jgi:hypothetical protein
MSNKISLAEAVLKANKISPFELEQVILDAGQIIEVNNEDYIGDNPNLDEVEAAYPEGRTPLAVDIQVDGIVVSSILHGSETNVEEVHFPANLVTKPINHIDELTTKSATPQRNLPHVYQFDEQGRSFMLTLQGIDEVSSSAEAPGHEVENDDVHDIFFDQFEEEFEEATLYLAHHISLCGDTVTSVFSLSTLPETDVSVYEFHGVQAVTHSNMLAA